MSRVPSGRIVLFSNPHDDGWSRNSTKYWNTKAGGYAALAKEGYTDFRLMKPDFPVRLFDEDRTDMLLIDTWTAARLDEKTLRWIPYQDEAEKWLTLLTRKPPP